MKKVFLTIATLLVTACAFAQFNVGSSTTSKTDIFGNTTTTHKDASGRVTGTSVTGKTDIFGNTTTVHKDAQGRTTGTSVTGQTDVFDTVGRSAGVEWSQYSDF